MSSFTNGSWWPTGRTVNGRAELCVVDGFSFHIGGPESKWVVDVPAGFLFDGASIPHWLRYFLPVGSIEVPAAVHDLLRKDVTTPLWFGNILFLHAMWVYGTPKWFAILAFTAVCFNRQRD